MSSFFRRVWYRFYHRKKLSIAPMPLPAAIPVEENEIAAVLQQFFPQHEVDDIIIQGVQAVAAPIMSRQILILDD